MKIDYQKIAYTKLDNIWNFMIEYKVGKMSITDLNKIFNLNIEKAPKTAIKVLRIMENKYCKNIEIPFHISCSNIVLQAIR